MVDDDALPPFDDAGGFGVLPEPPAGLADRIEHATTRRVRGRAWRRRGALALSLAAAFLAGAVTSRWPFDEPVPAPVVAPAPSTTAAVPRPATPGPADPAALSVALRERGDRLLAEAGDVEGALALYREHLELASLAGRPASDPRDSWLLSAMKNDLR